MRAPLVRWYLALAVGVLVSTSLALLRSAAVGLIATGMLVAGQQPAIA